MAMSKGLKVALILIAGSVVAVAVLGAVAVIWFKRNMGSFVESGKQGTAEGRAYGAQHAAADCLSESIVRLRATHSFADELTHRFFLRACLDVAAGPEFCQGVPSKGAILDSVKWSLSECTRLGAAPGEAVAQECTRVIQGAQEHCHEGRSKR